MYFSSSIPFEQWAQSIGNFLYGAWAGIGIGAAVVVGGADLTAILALSHYQKDALA